MTMMPVPLPTSAPSPAAGALPRLAGLVRKVLAHLGHALRVWQHRRMIAGLSRLDDRLLKDIGLTRDDLRQAAAEPLWCDPTLTAARFGHRCADPAPRGDGNAPPSAAEVDRWSGRRFPARSRYY